MIDSRRRTPTATTFSTSSRPTVAGVGLDGARARDVRSPHRHRRRRPDRLRRAPAEGASMRLFNADGSRAEVSGNGVRGAGGAAAAGDDRSTAAVTIETEGGVKRRGPARARRKPADVPRGDGSAGRPAAGDGSAPAANRVDAVVLNIGNPQCVVLGPLPDEERFRRLGRGARASRDVSRADQRRVRRRRGARTGAHPASGSAASVRRRRPGPDRAPRWWPRPRSAARRATPTVVAPGGTQRVEWRDDGVYLTGWAEVVCEGEWLRDCRVGTFFRLPSALIASALRGRAKSRSCARA